MQKVSIADIQLSSLSNDQLISLLAGMQNALVDAESFISGFEDDEDQEGIPTLLDTIRDFNEFTLTGWVLTDPSCNQYRKEIVKDEVYLFREDRIINPDTEETEVFEMEINYKNYTPEDLIEDCSTFGYSEEEVDGWVTNNEEIPLMLECVFELAS